MGTIQLILDKQQEFQERFGFAKDLPLSQKSNLIHTHALFLMEETFEMLRELPYHKYWKDYKNMSQDEIDKQLTLARVEWIDSLHFLMNIAVFLDMDEEMIRKMYLEKNGINIERQENPELGYVS